MEVRPVVSLRVSAWSVPIFGSGRPGPLAKTGNRLTRPIPRPDETFTHKRAAETMPASRNRVNGRLENWCNPGLMRLHHREGMYRGNTRLSICTVKYEAHRRKTATLRRWVSFFLSVRSGRTGQETFTWQRQDPEGT